MVKLLEKTLFKKLINTCLSNVAIYSNELYSLVKQEQQLTSSSSKIETNPAIVIVGREHCFECTKDIPIGKFDEAIQAASFVDNIAPFSGVNYFVAESISSEKTRIHYFMIKQSIYDEFSRSSLVIVPESLLVYLYLKKDKVPGIAKLKRNKGYLFATLNNDGFKSFISESGELEINQLLQYSIATNEVSVNVSHNDFLNNQLKAFFGLPRYCYKQVFNFFPIRKYLYLLPAKLMSVTISCIILLYFCISSSWLYFQGSNLDSELSEQRELLNDVFALQASLDEERAFQAGIANNTKLSTITSDVWLVILPLISTNSEVLSITYTSDEYTIRVKSPRSSEVIQFLSDNKNITTPKIVSPAIKSRGKEIISVKFSIAKTRYNTELKNEHS